MKIYLAGAWIDRESIQLLMKQLTDMGHVITHDWTTCELKYTDHHARNKKCALLDISGVCDCDLIIALMDRDDYPYYGTRHELGAAYAMRELRECGRLIGQVPKIWIVANKDPRITSREKLPACLQCCFQHIADDYFASMEDVLQRLQG